MYYIIYGFLYAFSLLPFFILYGISDFVAFLMYYVIRYRKEVVIKNLAIAFPEKTEKQRIAIAKRFYRNLVDTFIETIKLLSLPDKQISKRAVINMEDINRIAADGKTLQLMGAHQFNWEFVNLAIAEKIKIPWIGIYMRIKNDSVNKIIYNMRSRRGTVLVAAHEFASKRHSVFSGQYAIGLAADQNPGKVGEAYWINFFNRPTPFITGPDKGARKPGVAVIFVKFVKVKRGHYRFEHTVITENGETLNAYELLLKYRNFLEETIRQHPDNYLWSHNRFRWNYHSEANWVDTSPAPPDPSSVLRSS